MAHRPDQKKVFVATVSEGETAEAIRLTALLRENGIPAIKDVMERKLKAQFKYANKVGAGYVVTIGEEEVLKKVYPLKNMNSGEQQSCSEAELIELLKGEK